MPDPSAPPPDDPDLAGGREQLAAAEEKCERCGQPRKAHTLNAKMRPAAEPNLIVCWGYRPPWTEVPTDLEQLRKDLARARDRIAALEAECEALRSMACTCHYGGPTCRVHGYIGTPSATTLSPEVDGEKPRRDRCGAVIPMGPGVRGVLTCKLRPGHEGEHWNPRRCSRA